MFTMGCIYSESELCSATTNRGDSSWFSYGLEYQLNRGFGRPKVELTKVTCTVLAASSAVWKTFSTSVLWNLVTSVAVI